MGLIKPKGEREESDVVGAGSGYVRGRMVRWCIPAVMWTRRRHS